MFRPMISMAMKPQMSESDAGEAEIDRPDLRIADRPEQMDETAWPMRLQLPRGSGDAACAAGPRT